MNRILLVSMSVVLLSVRIQGDVSELFDNRQNLKADGYHYDGPVLDVPFLLPPEYIQSEYVAPENEIKSTVSPQPVKKPLLIKKDILPLKYDVPIQSSQKVVSNDIRRPIVSTITTVAASTTPNEFKYSYVKPTVTIKYETPKLSIVSGPQISKFEVPSLKVAKNAIRKTQTPKIVLKYDVPKPVALKPHLPRYNTPKLTKTAQTTTTVARDGYQYNVPAKASEPVKSPPPLPAVVLPSKPLPPPKKPSNEYLPPVKKRPVVKPTIIASTVAPVSPEVIKVSFVSTTQRPLPTPPVKVTPVIPQKPSVEYLPAKVKPTISVNSDTFAATLRPVSTTQRPLQTFSTALPLKVSPVIPQRPSAEYLPAKVKPLKPNYEYLPPKPVTSTTAVPVTTIVTTAFPTPSRPQIILVSQQTHLVPQANPTLAIPSTPRPPVSTTATPPVISTTYVQPTNEYLPPSITKRPLLQQVVVVTPKPLPTTVSSSPSTPVSVPVQAFPTIRVPIVPSKKLHPQPPVRAATAATVSSTVGSSAFSGYVYPNTPQPPFSF